MKVLLDVLRRAIRPGRVDLAVEPLHGGPAQAVLTRRRDALLDLPVDLPARLLPSSGLLLLRGFRGSPRAFSKLVERTSSEISLCPFRPFLPNTHAQFVDSGCGEVALHSENSSTPFRSGLIWFFCKRPADHGGRTVYCDGVQALAELSPSTRDLFSSTRIRYRYTYPEEVWRTFLRRTAPELGHVKDTRSLLWLRQASGDPTGLLQRWVEQDGLEINADGSLSTEFYRPAIQRTQFGGELAFANAIGSARAVQGVEVALEDGSPLSKEVLDDIEVATSRVAREIELEAGDVVLVDNTRVMHGRTRFTGSRRRVFAILSSL